MQTTRHDTARSSLDSARQTLAESGVVAQRLAGPLRAAELARVAALRAQNTSLRAALSSSGLGVIWLPWVVGGAVVSGAALWDRIRSHLTGVMTQQARLDCLERVVSSGTVSPADAARICTASDKPGLPAWVWGVGAGLVLVVLASVVRNPRRR